MHLWTLSIPPHTRLKRLFGQKNLYAKRRRQCTHTLLHTHAYIQRFSTSSSSHTFVFYSLLLHTPSCCCTNSQWKFSFSYAAPPSLFFFLLFGFASTPHTTLKSSQSCRYVLLLPPPFLKSLWLGWPLSYIDICVHWYNSKAIKNQPTG